MNLKYVLILMVIVAAGSAGLTRFYFPQVQLKQVEVSHDVIHNQIQTVIKTVKEKDGTEVTTQVITDNSTKSAFQQNTLQQNKQTQWMFDVGARTNFTDHEIVYDIQAQRRILGPFFLGAKASTDHSVGVSVGMEF
jgi:hypothetical protein